MRKSIAGRIRLLIPIFLLAVLLRPAPALAVQIQWTQTPQNAVYGDTVTVKFKITMDTASTIPSPLFLKVDWSGPSSGSGCSQQDAFNVAVGSSQEFTRTCQVIPEGAWQVTVRIGNTGFGWQTAGSTSFSVGVQYASVDQAKACLSVTATHTPAIPVADMPSQGNPDHRDKITLTITVYNSDSAKRTKAATLYVAVYEPGSVSRAGWSWSESVPELYSSANSGTRSKAFTQEFKVQVPGPYRFDFHLYSYDGIAVDNAGVSAAVGYKLGSYTITTVAYQNRSIAPAVAPDPGPHGGTFTFYATFSSADNVTPDSMWAYVDSQSHQMIRDTSYTQGLRYKYAVPLNYGAHTYYFEAKQGVSVIASTYVIHGPTVTDPNAPAVTGASPGADLKTDQSSVTLSGTASDPESGLASVEWSLDQTAWTQATGTASWSFTVPTSCADQEKKEFWVYVRGKDNAGNVTAAANYYKRKVVCDKRHPRILETFITDTSWLDGTFPSGISKVKPADHGAPTMNNTYFLCFKIENPSDLPQTITFGWKDDRYNIVRRPQSSGWDNYWPDNMDAANSWGPTPAPLPLDPKETIWVNIPWSHRWDWIPPQGWSDFLWDLVTAYIPVMNEYFDCLQFTQWGDTQHYFIPKVSWQTVPNGLSANIGGVPPQVQVDIKVSVPKQIAMYSSISAGVAGWLATAAGMVLVAFPPTIPGGVAMFVAEAAFIVTSHALYTAAYDPDADFQTPVKARPIKTTALDGIKDAKSRKQAQAALDMAADAVALSESYAKYLGAVQKKDAKWARTHVQESGQFAKSLESSARLLDPLLKTIPDVIKKAKPETTASVKKSLLAGNLPDVELRVLRDAGFSDKDIRDCSKANATGLDLLLKQPQLAGAMNDRMIKALGRFSAEMEKAPANPPAKPPVKPPKKK